MFILPLQGNKGYLSILHDKQKLFCMKKIPVPTDFSVNSKSGVRFAIHWTTQQKMELLFIHVLYVLRATRWSEAYFEKYATQEKASCKTKFEKFISGIY